MRKGILFNPNRLVLVTSAGHSVRDQDLGDDAAVDYQSRPDGEVLIPVDDSDRTRMTMLVLVAVSIACTTAAVATGSYAVWLSRHQATRQALTDVNDILKSCQTRMQQLEADVKRLPERQA